jgi:flagellar biosynthetic protein FliR
MTGPELLADLPRWAFGFVLVLARTGACVMLLPGLGEAALPQTVRAGLALALTILLLPGLLPALPAVPDHPASLAAFLAADLLAGASLGWLARLVVLAMPMAGHIASHMMGLSNVLTPDLDLGGQASALERFFGIAATTLVLASGLYALPLAALAGSYRPWPPGSFAPAPDAPGAVVAALGEAFALALQLAAPFVLAGIVWQVALGLLGRLVPRLQTYFIAMPAQILGGLTLLGLLGAALLGAWADALRESWARLPGLG